MNSKQEVLSLVSCNDSSLSVLMNTNRTNNAPKSLKYFLSFGRGGAGVGEVAPGEGGGEVQ